MPERRRLIAKLKDPEDKVRKFVGVAGVSVALLAAACTGTEQSVDEGLRKDLELASTDEEDTRNLGERLGKQLRKGDIVLLSGELGAGKTCLTQGIGRDVE